MRGFFFDRSTILHLAFCILHGYKTGFKQSFWERARETLSGKKGVPAKMPL
ncbi:MAG: hypothetical protein LBL66_01570 [Clostridiales bacterium]|jgi:hypothetical protein|nr:hypothetical protein [Clostridiales bacterium]